jgi:toxin ParE1/3/4
MAEVIWRNQALDDLDQVIRYIGQFDPEAADAIGVRLFDLGESLADFPRRGRPAANGLREWVNVQPYILTYDAQEGSVFIQSIRHSARDLP